MKQNHIEHKEIKAKKPMLKLSTANVWILSNNVSICIIAKPK